MKMHRIWMLVFVLSLCSPLPGIGQYRADFESNNVGTQYSGSTWENEGFGSIPWTNGSDRATTSTLTAYAGEKSLQVVYPQGQYGTGGTGHQAPLPLDASQEYYASYWLKFSSDFSWGTTSEGGKLPGLGSDGLCSGGRTCDGTNGFTSRYMWRNDGRAVVYLYHMDKPSTFGEDIQLKDAQGEDVYFPRDEWVNLTQRVKMNTGNNNDGELQVWFNGEEAINMGGLRFVNNGDLIDRFIFSTFHGGGNSGWAPQNDCEIWFDEIIISTDPSDVFNALCVTPELGEDIVLCDGLPLQLAPEVKGEFDFVWKKDGESVSLSTSLEVTAPGLYELTISNQECEPLSDQVIVSGYQAFQGVNDTICAEGEALFSANAEEVSWFDSPQDGVFLGAGPELVQEITETTSRFFEVDEENIYDGIGEVEQNGAVWNTTNLSAADKSIKLEVEAAFTLNSLAVYPSGSGTDVHLRILEDDQATEFATFDFVDLNAGKQVLELNIVLPIGTYYLDLVGTSKAMAFQNENAQFPYEVPGVMSFTYVENWQSEWYGLFYDWRITVNEKSACRVEVTGVIDPTNASCIVASVHSRNTEPWQLIPHPVQDHFRIPQLQTDMSVRILDTQGQEWADIVQEGEHFYVGTLAPGLYLLSINGQVVQRFVKF